MTPVALHVQGGPTKLSHCQIINKAIKMPPIKLDFFSRKIKVSNKHYNTVT